MERICHERGGILLRIERTTKGRKGTERILCGKQEQNVRIYMYENVQLKLTCLNSTRIWICTRSSAYILQFVVGLVFLVGLLTEGVRGVFDTLACSWDSFPPTGFPYPALVLLYLVVLCLVDVPERPALFWQEMGQEYMEEKGGRGEQEDWRQSWGQNV